MKQFLYSLIIIFLFSCTSNTIYKKPKNLISKDSMLMLLTDMHIAASAKFSKNKNLERDINYMVLVYKKYKIDSTRFKKSNIYYTSRIEEYNEMLKEVKRRLQFKRDTIKKRIQHKDSLDAIKKVEDIKNNNKLDSIDIRDFE